MIFYIEVGKPITWKPWHYRSRIAWRLGWLVFCIGWSKYSINETIEKAATGKIYFEKI